MVHEGWKTMRVIALTGLHGAGKGKVARILESCHGFIALDKRAYLKRIHKAVASDHDFESWCRTLYRESGGGAIMSEIWSSFITDCALPYRTLRVVVDSVHNVQEWLCLKEISPESDLVYVVTSPQLRAERTSDDHLQLDQRRIAYSHDVCGQNAKIDCLYAMVDWSLCNNGNEEYLKAQIRQLAGTLPD